MATLYRSIDEEMTVDDGYVTNQVPSQPGKPTVMASLVFDGEAGAARQLPETAEIRPEAIQHSRTGTAAPAVQRQPGLPAASPPTPSSALAQKPATQEPIAAEGSSKAESQSTDFDWMGEREWTSLKSFMEGHQKKLAEETGGAKEEPMQRATEEVGRQATQDKTEAELARRQELARRGQLPRAQIEYISSEEGQGTGATQSSSPAATEHVQRLPLEPELSSAGPEVETGIEQSDIPVDDDAPIPVQTPPIVQRTQASKSSPTPEAGQPVGPRAQDAPSNLESASADVTSGQDEPDKAIGAPEVLSKPGSPEIEEAPDVQRAPEVAISRPEMGDRPAPEAIKKAPSPKVEGRTGLGNRLLAAAKSLFRGDDGPGDSPSPVVDIEPDVNPDVETPTLSGQELVQRAPVEGDSIVEDVPKSSGVAPDLSPEFIDDVESPVIPVDAPDQLDSSVPVIDPKQEPIAESAADIPAEEVPVFSGDQPALDPPKIGPASVTTPDINHKLAEAADSKSGVRPATVEWQPAAKPAQDLESVDTAGTDETIISEPSHPVNSGDEVDTIIQGSQGPGPVTPLPTLQRKEVMESPSSPQMAGPTGKAEPSIIEPASPIDAGTEVDTVIPKSEDSIDSRDVKEERQKSPQMPSEPQYRPALETESSEPPIQALPLDAVWPVEKLEAPTITPPPLKKGIATQPGPAIQRKPAGDDNLTGELHSALKDVAPGQPTDSSIELVTPRRPRPVPPARPQSPVADTQRKPAEAKPPAPTVSPPTADQAALGEKESPYLVSTEVGDLPSDLWEYLGEKPPPRSSEKSSSQETIGDLSPPDLQRDVEPSQQLVTREFPLADVQREVSSLGRRGGGSADADESGESEDKSSSQKDVDISELARQVFPEIKRRLNVDWERGRGRF